MRVESAASNADKFTIANNQRCHADDECVFAASAHLRFDTITPTNDVTARERAVRATAHYCR